MTRAQMVKLTDDVWRRDGYCIHKGDGTCSTIREAHHVIKQQQLTRLLRGEDLTRALCDPRGAVAVCRLHHGRIHAALLRVPPTVLMQIGFYMPGDAVDEPTFTGDFDLRAIWEGIVAKQLPTHRRLEA